jgi:undecaprenyl-diphosphatase
LAAAPIIFGATIFGLRNVPFESLISLPWIIGFLAAGASSIWAMKFLLKYVKNNNFNVFVLYRIALAIVIVLIYLWR